MEREKRKVPESAINGEPARGVPVQQSSLAQLVAGSSRMRDQAQLIAGIASSPRVLAQRVQVPGVAHGIPDGLRQGVEQLSGTSMEGVNVHYNSPEPARMQALAFARGNAIHLGPGQERHLPHEAWHIAQQRQGRVRATTKAKGARLNDDPALENEADRMGALAAQFNPRAESIPMPALGAGGAAVAQRRVGVEYETNWTVSGDMAENHKKPIYNGVGWRVESDANNLEFVVEPPANSAAALKATVSTMVAMARHILGNAGGGTTPIADALGTAPEPRFENESITPSSDANMSAKAQFTFGVSMENLAGLLDKLAKGNHVPASYDEGHKGFHFEKNKAATTREFLGGTLKHDVAKSDAYRHAATKLANDQSPAVKGFLSYLSYYIKSMQTTYSDKQFTKFHRAGHVAQELVRLYAQGSTLKIDDVCKGLGYPGDILHELWVEANTDSCLTEDGLTVDALGGEDVDNLKKFIDERLKEFDYPKYRFMLMNRSGFDKMYQALSDTDQAWIAENKAQFIEQLGLSQDKPLFDSPYTFKTQISDTQTERGFTRGPTVGAWMDSIIASGEASRDMMSPPPEFIDHHGVADPEQSLGALGLLDTQIVSVPQVRSNGNGAHTVGEVEKQTRLVVIELRAWGDWLRPEEWAEHSYDMAFIHNQLAPGSLNTDEHTYETRLAELKDQRIRVEARITALREKKRKLNASGSGSQQHIAGMHRGLNNQIANAAADVRFVVSEIVALKVQYLR